MGWWDGFYHLDEHHRVMEERYRDLAYRVKQLEDRLKDLQDQKSTLLPTFVRTPREEALIEARLQAQSARRAGELMLRAAREAAQKVR